MSVRIYGRPHPASGNPWRVAFGIGARVAYGTAIPQLVAITPPGVPRDLRPGALGSVSEGMNPLAEPLSFPFWGLPESQRIERALHRPGAFPTLYRPLPHATSTGARAMNGLWASIGLSPSWTDNDYVEEMLLVLTLPMDLPFTRGAQLGELTGTPTWTKSVGWSRALARALAGGEKEELVAVRWAEARPGGPILKALFGKGIRSLIEEQSASHPFVAKAGVALYLLSERIISIAIVQTLIPTVTQGVWREIAQGEKLPPEAQDWAALIAGFEQRGRAYGMEQIGQARRTVLAYVEAAVRDVSFEILWVALPPDVRAIAAPYREQLREKYDEALTILLREIEGG